VTDAAVADPHGAGGPAVDVAALEEVLLQLLFGDLIGRFVIELAEHAQRAHVRLLGSFSEAVQLQGVGGFLVPVGHEASPVGGLRRGLRRRHRR
jgi:hypothetical protein